MHEHPDHDTTAVLLKAKTPFEGEAIAAALRERGVDARVLNSASWQATSGMFSQIEVVVLRSQLESARAVLAEIRGEFGDAMGSAADGDAEGASWEDQADNSADAAAINAEMQRTRTGRFTLTVAVLLLPLGLMVLSAGTTYRSTSAQVIGGVLLVMAMLIVALRFLVGDKESEAET